MSKTRKPYRDEMEKIYDFLELCSNKEINRSVIGRTINLSSGKVIEFTSILMELGYLESMDSGIEYGNGKMLYYKTTPKGTEFKQIISGWVKLRRRHQN